MAHANEDPCDTYIKLEEEGEGNYASTGFFGTRDPQTDQGLTPLPKILSSDQWQFDAARSLSNQDLEDLLGSVQSDLLEDEDARPDDSWVNALLEEPTPCAPYESSPNRESTIDPDEELQPSKAPLTSPFTREPIKESVEQPRAVLRCETLPASPYDQAPRHQSPTVSLLCRSPIDSGYGPSIPDSSRCGSASENVPVAGNESEPVLERHDGGVREEPVKGADHEGFAIEDEDYQLQYPQENLHIQNPPTPRHIPGQQSQNHSRLSTSRTASQQPVRVKSRLATSLLDPDVPITSIEKFPKTVKAGVKLPYWMTRERRSRMSKKAAIELGKRKGLFGGVGGHEKIEKRSQIQASVAQNFDIPSTPNPNPQPKSLNSNHRNLHDSNMAPNESLRDALALASTIIMAAPDRVNLFYFLGTIKAVLSKGLPGPVPGVSPTVDQLPLAERQQWDAFFTQLSDNKNNCREYGILWVIEKIEKMIEEDAEYHEQSEMLFVNTGLGGLDLLGCHAMIRAQRTNISFLEGQFEKVQASFQTDQTATKDAQLQSLQARLRDMTAERDMYKVIAQAVPIQPLHQAVASDGTPTKSVTSRPVRNRTPPIPNTDEGLNGHPRWQCVLSDWQNNGQCLGINYQFYSRGSKWVSRTHCFKCKRPNSDKRYWLEPRMPGTPKQKPRRPQQTITPPKDGSTQGIIAETSAGSVPVIEAPQTTVSIYTTPEETPKAATSSASAEDGPPAKKLCVETAQTTTNERRKMLIRGFAGALTLPPHGPFPAFAPAAPTSQVPDPARQPKEKGPKEKEPKAVNELEVATIVDDFDWTELFGEMEASGLYKPTENLDC